MATQAAIQPKRSNHRWLTRYVIPLLAAAVVLGIFNVALYSRLSPSRPFAIYALPFSDDFAQDSIGQWFKFDGEWKVSEGGLIQANPDAQKAGIYLPLWLDQGQPYQAQARLVLENSSTPAGMSFNAQYPSVQQKRHFVEIAAVDGKWQVNCGYTQGSESKSQAVVPLELPVDQPLDARLRVDVGKESYSVALDDKVLVRDVPLQYQGGLVGLNATGAPVRFDDLAVTGLGEAAPAKPQVDPQQAQTLPDKAGVLYTSDFTGDIAASGWVPMSGDWVFRDGALVQQQPNEFDRNISYNQPFESYRMTVKFRINQGTGAGLLFNMPDPTSKKGAHMVRYADDGSGVFWGYFDKDGAFTGQGFKGASAPGTDSHVLEVISGVDTYAILLDGQQLADQVPLVSQRGYPGLTTSESVASFQQVKISSMNSTETALVGDQNAAPVTDAQASNLLANTQTLSGEWVKEGATIRQQATEATDYVTGIGVLAEQYTLSAKIELPKDVADGGGGVIFHMPKRDDSKGAYMVRFGDGGKQLFWGRYSQAGEFQGIGSAPLETETGQPHQLTLVVKKGAFDVLVDGEQITADAPLDANSGWIGLTSFRGPTVFSDLQMTLGEPSK
ncbi:MAG: hypothetical protein IPK16_33515 [Anaerolineales bacterium]|nr:hypothetical protein [Anaerolineales bacterium]